MVIGMFSIYDRKAGVYFPPQAYLNEDVAKRSLRLEFEKKQLSPMVSFPDDFELYCIGRFCDSTATLHVDGPPPRRVCSLVELVRCAVDEDGAAAEGS